MTTTEIVTLLGGPTAAGRFFRVRPPSVAGWLKSGVIPEGRLLRRAAQLEAVKPGGFRRCDQWPDDYLEIWPELAAVPDGVVDGAEQVTAEGAVAV